MFVFFNIGFPLCIPKIVQKGSTQIFTYHEVGGSQVYSFHKTFCVTHGATESHPAQISRVKRAQASGEERESSTKETPWLCYQKQLAN